VALEKYRAKRNFKESPEPSGDKAHKSPGGRTPRFFCVQKHLASHLHYDFRLEHNGVLLSWAVPKGPSLDPTVKRLAMAVEDHPIEYGDFEGVIPSGYGAGIVMLWDVGTWSPEVDDVEAALKKGDLKLTLNGVKLKGSWVLVRTKGGSWGSRSSGGADRSWLLIKHKDDWAGPVDIAEFAPLSVKSSGDFADILASGNPDIWQSNRPAQGGEAGAMFERIIERALAMRDEQDSRGSKRAEGARGAAGKGSKSAEGAQGAAGRGSERAGAVKTRAVSRRPSAAAAAKKKTTAVKKTAGTKKKTARAKPR
jgi:bifunctional non-homologous end joining protein LigD